jgi:homoserine kinase type II
MAVYTRLTQEEIATHLRNYSIGELVDFQEILAGIDNSNFILNTTQGRFILTIFEARINKDELPFFVNFKLHLAKKGVRCPRPILDNAGAAIVDLKGKKSAIVTFLSGKTLQPREDGYYDNITPKHCAQIGKTLAQLHLAAADFEMTRRNDLSVTDWKPLFSKFAILLDDYEKNLRSEILQTLDFLEKRWNHKLPTAATHLDLFPDNVFFENKQVSGVIDFYFSATDALIYDFAVTANAWCFDEKNNFLTENFAALFVGYESVRKFSENEKKFLEIAFVGAAMRFLLTRLHDMFFTPKDSLVKVKNPQEYLTKLRFFCSKIS